MLFLSPSSNESHHYMALNCIIFIDKPFNNYLNLHTKRRYFEILKESENENHDTTIQYVCSREKKSDFESTTSF